MHLRNVRITYSGVASTAALVIALSAGGAYAANLIGTKQIAKGAVTTAKIHQGAVTTAKIHKGAVGTAKIKKGAVGPAKIKDGSITGSKVADGSLTTADLSNGSVTSAKLDAATKADIVPAWGTIPSGKTVMGVLYSDSHSGPAADSQVAAIVLPAAAPATPIIGYGTPTYGNSVDPRCSGTAAQPTASPGLLCIYIDYSFGFKNINAGMLSYGNYLRFGYIRLGEAGPNLDTYYGGSWAYTAP